MDVPLNARVRCADGDSGRTTRIVLNPATRQVTHVVVREPGPLGVERLVPVQEIVASTPRSVTLRLTRHELAQMQRFTTSESVALPDESLELAEMQQLITGEVVTRPDEPLELAASPGAPFLWSDGGRRGEGLAVPVEAIAPDELAVRRGDRVEATDGLIGRVDELLVDHASGALAALVLREGHLWGQKDATIPAARVARIEEGVVHLALDKRAVAALPAVPVRRAG